MTKAELIVAIRTLPKEEFIKYCLGRTHFSRASLDDAWDTYRKTHKTAK